MALLQEACPLLKYHVGCFPKLFQALYNAGQVPAAITTLDTFVRGLLDELNPGKLLTPMQVGEVLLPAARAAAHRRSRPVPPPTASCPWLVAHHNGVQPPAS